MTATTEQSGANFSLGMLIYDTRYRSLTIQIIALMIFMLALGWLASNAVQNLADLGKEFSFSFMTDPSSYDINQRLIDYTSRSSHATAAVVGIINTLLVAAMGCIAATVVGVLAGVMRLSKNWVVAKLMTVYVEVFRNIPVLLLIILVAAVLNETLPSPKQAGPMLGGLLVATNRGVYIPMPIFGDGSLYVVLALIAGIVAAVWFRRWAIRQQQETGREFPVFWIVLGLIVVPAVLLFLIMGAPITLEYPVLTGFNFKGGIFARTSLVAIWLALSLYTGAFIAEIVRAGIQSVSKGQTEAAFALGLQPGRTMRMVILPQALRVINPPMISEFLSLTKNSSLAIAVGYMDATGTLGGITLNQTGKEMETILLLMLFYLVISLSISFVMNLYDESVKLVERTSATGHGLHFAALFGGNWEQLKKGDAQMHGNFGVAGWLNLVVLFYVLWFLAMLDFVFVADWRDSYWAWPLLTKASALLMIVFSGAALATSMFKSSRFLDLAFVEALAFLFAMVVGYHFGAMFSGVSGLAVVVAGTAIRLAIILYVALGARPNITYLHRVRKGTP